MFFSTSLITNMQTQKSNVFVNGKVLSLHQLTGQSAHDALVEMKRLSLDDHKKFRLPGPNPVSIEKKDLAKLKNSYVISPKTDGTRYILMFTRLYKYKVVMIVDRAMNVYLLPLQIVPRNLYQGTIFDGELTVTKTGTPTFVLFDAVVVAGVTVSHLTMGDRIIAMRRSLRSFRTHEKDPAVLAMKDWAPIESPNVKTRLKVSEDMYHTDGYVMVNVNKQVTYGRDFDFFKVKPHDKHTVDFIVLDAAGTLGLFDPKVRQNVPVTKYDTTKHMFLIGTVVECSFKNYAWTPLQMRADKTEANDILTYERTLVNIEEHITLDDILDAVNKA
ncbi:mRNA-capping enzyme (mRNA guanylyltransferase) [Acanthocystis turfacea Chlorella virus OR0704.3]|nr:mRNA-capping enzyme (mRNA guanylyltransferase) [Acanthocystis turfacea Chlorella virus OR0704.3]